MCRHSFICLDPLGDTEGCVLCWTGRTMLGTLRLTAEVVRDLEQGFVIIPDQAQFYTGDEPLWLKEPPQKHRGRVLPLQDYKRLVKA
mgnify:CR=1 FL=1